MELSAPFTQSNIYSVDASLVGRQVELVFDPFDLHDIDVQFSASSILVTHSM
ncbi:hypothetical protein ACIGDI_42065 [Streptomyces sp. NPDC085900]|uniref:hypothetical protein n=1 Tax=Streptomyces sp. NPDC085900 TaxID=3365737 RepID=UPI0037D7C167